ncbi:MAG: hypothetical protein P4N41_15405 [Negativicutes bacterium]|nr:hypothetical protein [Negativicutes bacterium]
MKKTMGILLIFLAVLWVPATAFMAWGPSYEGEPAMLSPNHISGAFVWHDASGFHLRTMTTGDTHTFSGTIHTNGHFVGVDDRFFRDKDYYHFTDGDTVEFQITTDGRTVGLDFDVADGDYMAFELKMDGGKLSPLQIFVGQSGWHPGDYKFTLNRPPYYYGDRYDRSVILVHPGWYGHWGWGYRHW